MALLPDITSAELFIKYDYAETKDLAKHFLTLISAILVFSLTFSEKVVGFSSAKTVSRWSLLACWMALLISMTLCGLAICCISLAGGQAVYGGYYFDYAQTAWILMLWAGSLFILGLMALIVAGGISVLQSTSISKEQMEVAQVKEEPAQTEAWPEGARSIGDQGAVAGGLGESENRS